MRNLLQKLALRNDTTTTRILLLGDSVSLQVFLGLQCKLFLAGLLTNQSSYALVKGWGKCRAWPWLTICFHESGRADSLKWTPTSSKSGFEVLQDDLHLRSELERGDVVILNEGVHHRKGRDDKELKRILGHIIATKRSIQRLQHLGVKLLWRETLAQHFNTTTGAYPHHSFGDPLWLPCDQIPDPSFVIERNQQVSSMVRGAGISVIPTFNASMNVSSYNEHPSSAITREEHVLEVNRTGVAQKADCTHFCEPSQTLDTVIERVIQSISEVI